MMKAVKGRIHAHPVTQPPARPGESWGGYVVLPRAGRILQVRLTGVLTDERLRALQGSLRAQWDEENVARFVLLDASQLLHLPVAVAMGLYRAELRWRQEGAVVLWVGLSPYLANVLLLASSGERIPSLPDLETAFDAVGRMAGLPPTVARERLEAWDIMRH